MAAVVRGGRQIIVSHVCCFVPVALVVFLAARNGPQLVTEVSTAHKNVNKEKCRNSSQLITLKLRAKFSPTMTDFFGNTGVHSKK